jgi:hypothetical protein
MTTTFAAYIYVSIMMLASMMIYASKFPVRSVKVNQ